MWKDAWLSSVGFVYGYSVHWKVLRCHLAVGHGSNVAAWTHVKPGLEQCRGRALSHLWELPHAM